MESKQVSGAGETPAADEKIFWAHVIPFGVWMACIMFFGEPAGWKYAVRSGLGLAALAWFRPWRWYARFQVRNLPWAVCAGVAVFVIWVLPETSWAERFPRFQHLYLLVGIMPPWSLPDPVTETPYAPATCGWVLALVRLGGSALVIPVIEEFFWRGFLYRWLVKEDFSAVSLRLLRWGALLGSAALFATVHDRWLVAVVTGVIYGLLVIRTGDIWAGAVAHAVTNGLLGWYVLKTGAYQFW